jgi:hypothetical protein
MKIWKANGGLKFVPNVGRQSKIGSAVGTFQPFKSAQTDEIVHMLLQHETDNLGC